MRVVMMNTCQIVICLFAVSNGQTPRMSVVGEYVNKSGIAYVTCSIGTTITGNIAIARNGALAFDCPIPNTCADQGLSADYTATQAVNNGTTTVTIRNADKSRDGVNWTCSYNSGTLSNPVTLNVVSPAMSSRLIEEADMITLELTCTYPNNLLSLEFYLGSDLYSNATPNRTGFQTCTPNYEASVNYTLTFQKTHSKSYNGTFTAYYNNGFYTSLQTGTKNYNFSANILTTSTPPPTATVKETSTIPTSTPMTNNTSTTNEIGKDSKQLIIISVSVSGGVIVLGVIIISCWFCCRHVTSTSEDDSCPDRNYDKGTSNAQIQFSTHTSDQTSTSCQDGKDKTFAKKSEIKEGEHGKHEATSL